MNTPAKHGDTAKRLMTTYDGDRIEVAENPLTHRWERVYPESELGGQKPTTLYWCQSAGRYVTIPEDRPTMEETYEATLAGIGELKACAYEILQQEFDGIAEAAGRDDALAVSLRLKRRNLLERLFHDTAWLATELTDVLLKVASGISPSAHDS